MRRNIRGVEEIIKNYEAFLVDLWGVVHNGVKLFPNILKVLQKIKEYNKEVIFITNAPRRSNVIKDQLKFFGVDYSSYKDVISSGEISYEKMKTLIANSHRKLFCYHIGPSRDNNLIDSLNLTITKEVSKTDFILNTGPWGDDDILENYTNILDNLRKKNLPMICSNPDKVVIRDENFMICAGLLAEYYENIGGIVEYFGKPLPLIYNVCFEKLKTKNKKKILVIGDSLENDIKGANMQGLDSILVTSGIHRRVNNNNMNIDIKKLDDLMNKKNIFAKYYIYELCW